VVVDIDVMSVDILVEACKLIEFRKFSLANDILKSGTQRFNESLEAINRSYFVDELDDDKSDEQIRLAEEKERSGQFEECVTLRYAALRYRQKKLSELYDRKSLPN
jgi:hypothetical protein